MFCDQCGTEVPEGGAFCPNCGNRLANDNVQSPEVFEAETVQNVEVSEKTEETQNPEMTVEGEAAAANCETAQQSGTAAANEETSGEPRAVNAEAAEEPEAANGEAAEQPGIPQGAENGQAQELQRRFCPNCGTENSMTDTFCKECGMPLDGTVYSVGAVGQGMQMNQPPAGAKSNKKVGLVIGLCVAAAVLILAIIVIAVRGLTLGPKGKVLQAIAATMKDTPEVVGDLKKAGDILLEDSFTVGLNMEVDGDTVNGEFRNTIKDKQIYLTMDIDGDGLDLLCGVHSGVFKAEVLDWDHLFMYDPKRDNDGFLCEQLRKKELEQLNTMLENITSDKVSTKELQKELMSALLQESEELEFKEAKAKEFEVDGKDRECEGYKVRINEKNIARFAEYVGEIVTKRMPEDLVDDFTDELDYLVEEIKGDDFDADITFYLYKKKLAAMILEVDDYGDEAWVIEFQGGDYRMQNMMISLQYDGDTYAEVEINSRKKGSVETINIESDGGVEAAITYDTKSGAISLEYDDDWTECLIEGVYKCSGSEVSFVLEEFEMDGDSMVEDDDVSLTIYAKKAVDIQKYSGEEFDLGAAEEDDFEDLVDELEDYDGLLNYWLY